MKIKRIHNILALGLAATTSFAAEAPKMKMTTDIPVELTTPDQVETRLGTLQFFDGFPDQATVAKVYDNLDFMRGVQAFLNAGPGASTVAIRHGLREFGPDEGKGGKFLTLNATQTKPPANSPAKHLGPNISRP